MNRGAVGYRGFAAAVTITVAMSVLMTAAAADENSFEGKKRDPFVALVRSDGKIKSRDELFPSLSKKSSLSMNIKINAIIWDEERPLIMINNKIYNEGQEISEGLSVKKIFANGVVLDDNGNEVNMPLRKPREK